MQGVKLSGMEEFNDKLNKLLDEAPGMRKKLHEDISNMAKQEIDAHIVGTGVEDNRSKIRDWQERYVGSGGGYAAIRPSSKSTGANSPGAITNYLDSGHRIRPPSGQSKRYKPRIKKVYVDGFHFYQNAQSKVEAKAIKMAEMFADKLSNRIRGD